MYLSWDWIAVEFSEESPRLFGEFPPYQSESDSEEMGSKQNPLVPATVLSILDLNL